MNPAGGFDVPAYLRARRRAGFDPPSHLFTLEELGYKQPGLCTCFPYTWAPARPVSQVSEVEVFDPMCKHHGDVS